MNKVQKWLKNITIDWVIKLSIIIFILSIGFSLFFYYVIFLPQKERTELKQQKQEQLLKQEQERKEYNVKRKGECYDIYIQEKKNWNNVVDFSYSEVRDVCLVKYKSTEPAKTAKECEKITANISDITSDTFRDLVWNSYFDCLDNWFSKSF